VSFVLIGGVGVAASTPFLFFQYNYYIINTKIMQAKQAKKR
jgi:hypothetical protein